MKLTKEGITMVDIARQKKGWSKTKWWVSAYVSRSTLQRFIRGESISPENFKTLCEVVGIEEWQSLVDWENSDSTAVAQLSKEPQGEPFSKKKPPSKGGIGVTGIFASDKKLEVEMALEHLKQLLMNCKVVIKLAEEPSFHNAFSVYGLFSPDQQLEMKVALEHLRQLLITCTVTIM